MINTVSPRVVSLVFRGFAAVLLGLIVSSSLSGQPSGGPYGPQVQRYELPKVAGRLYFVSPTGKAEASGASLAEPCSLSSAVERVVSGDAVILRGGEYRTGDLRVNQGVLFQAYADEQPLLKGTEVAADWTLQKNGLWRTKWTHLFPGKPADWWRRESVGRKTPLHRFNMDLVFVDGRRLHSAGWEGELDADSFYIDYERGEVYISVDPKEHVVEITAHDGGLLRTISPCHGKQPDNGGLQLRGVSFTQYAYRAVEIEGREPEGLADPSTFGKDVVGSLLENVSITHCSRVAAYLRGDGLVVRNCLVSDTVTEGIYVLASSDCLLERNIFRRNNVDNMLGYFPSAVKIFNQTRRVVCRDNLVTDMRNSNGIWYDVGNIDGVVVNNWFEDAQSGFFFEISKRAVCVGNVFVDCAQGVYVLNSCGVEVYQNTFVNSPTTFERNERSAVADHFGWHPSTGPGVEARVDHVFVNNLLAGNATLSGALLRVVQSKLVNPTVRSSQLVALEGNLYVRTGVVPKTLIEWGPATEALSSIPLSSLEELRNLRPDFEKKGLALQTGDGAFFKSWDLKDYHPLKALIPSGMAAAQADGLPARVKSLISRPDQEKLIPGAYPAF